MQDSDPNESEHSLTSLDNIVRLFDQNWDGSNASLVRYWKSLQEKQSMVVLSALIKHDLQRRFQRGECPTAAEYFELFPELTQGNDWALSLLYVEFCLLEETNHAPNVSNFCARYELYRDSLASQLAYHRNFSQIVGSERPRVKYPSVGDRFGTYQLSSLLGVGGAAQVYRATDDLGGRQVVLKVSPSVGREPSILASLEHRNIVPIFTVVESPESGLRGICMPYRAGLTLESILKSFSETGLPKKAAPIWNLLEVDQVDQETIEHGWKDFPVKGTYTEAVAWLGFSVANALVYLHARGIFHRDIKPANILLANREGPLLFDFNLAHTPHAAEHAQSAILGGTLPYMAPEQLGAFLDPAKWENVGASADIYALGLVLRELVTGLKPDLPNSSLPLNRAIQDLRDRRHELLAPIRVNHPEVPPSLEAIILHCLAFNPQDRYPSASELSEDLRRFLRRKPLKYAPNSSKFEVSINWIICQRKAFAGASLLLFFFGLIYQTSHTPSAPLRVDPPLDVKNPLLPDSPPPSSNPPVQGEAPRFLALQNKSFRLAVAHLDSQDPSLWSEARKTFERLHREHPHSAWPTLYLALCLEKLGDHSQAQRFTKEICSNADGAEAIEQRLLEDPTSVSMKVLLGYYHSTSPWKNLEKARRSLNEAIILEPEHVGAVALLADLARSDSRKTEAIKLYQKAIEVASRKGPSHIVTSSRAFLIPVMLAEADRLLLDPKNAANPEVKDLLDQVNIHLPMLEVDWKKEADSPASKSACSIAICRGSLNSAWAYLHALKGQESEALEKFQIAANYFNKAIETNSAIQVDPKKAAKQREFDDYIRSQQIGLTQRLTVSGIKPKAISFH